MALSGADLAGRRRLRFSFFADANARDPGARDRAALDRVVSDRAFRSSDFLSGNWGPVAQVVRAHA